MRPLNTLPLMLIVLPLAAAELRTAAKIYFSSAPWDGAAYDIHIPIKKSAEAPDPVISVNIWGNPEYSVPTTVQFTGHDEAGGGPGMGAGRASYQAVIGKTLPEPLSGTLSFKSLKHGQPVDASYDLKTAKGKRYKGLFRAAWGNASAGMIR